MCDALCCRSVWLKGQADAPAAHACRVYPARLACGLLRVRSRDYVFVSSREPRHAALARCFLPSLSLLWVRVTLARHNRGFCLLMVAFVQIHFHWHENLLTRIGLSPLVTVAKKEK